MAKYLVTFEHTFKVEADNEDEAFEIASERASEWRLDEANDITVEELDKGE